MKNRKFTHENEPESNLIENKTIKSIGTHNH